MKKSVLLWFLVSLVLAACGGGENPDVEAAKKVPENQTVGNQKAEILSGADTLQFGGGAIQGTGAVRFTDVLEKPESANNFSLRLELGEGQSATLIVNSDRNLSVGIEIEVSRPLGAANLNVVIKAGSDTLDVSSFFASVDATQEMALSFDVHNDHGASVHVLAWNDLIGQELLADMIRGRGFGANWGLKLNGAKVNGIEKSGPRDEH